MQAHTLGLERGYPQECVLFCLLGDQTQDTSSVGLSEGSWCFLNQKPPPCTCNCVSASWGKRQAGLAEENGGAIAH